MMVAGEEWVPIYRYHMSEIYYERRGTRDDRALVILNGLGGSTQGWTRLAEGLREIVGVLLLDYPGHGGSSLLPDERKVSQQHHAMLESLFAHLGLRKVALLGFSYGGKLALRFALQHPEMVEALMLISTSPLQTEGRKALFTSWSSVLEAQGLEGLYEVMMKACHAPQFLSLHRDDILSHRELFVRANREKVLRAELSQLIADDSVPLHDLERIQVSTLVLYGGCDAIVEQAQVDALEHLRNVQLVCFPQCGHMLQHEEPERCASILRAFLHETLR